MKPQSKRGALGLGLILSAALFFWAFIGAILFLVGCTTVIPDRFTDKTPSYSESGKADSGIVGFHTNGNGVVFLEVMPSYRNRYNAMIPVYGGTNNFRPPLQLDEGITPRGTNGTFLIDLDHAAKFNRMNRARKSN